MCSIDQASPPGHDASSETRTNGPARSIEQLEQEICELAAHLAAATCRWLVLLAEFDERSGWAQWGVKSCAHWLSWRCSCGLGAAREHVRVARRLQELPRVREAFAAGELSYCKTRAITRVATAQTEQQLVTLARYASGAQLEKLVRSYRGALAATVPAASRAHELRYLRWDWNEDGSLRLQGRLPADAGALLVAALEQAEQPSTAPTDAPTQTYEADPAAARRADALITIARTAFDATPRQRTGGDPVELVVHVDVDTLAADQVRECSEVENGPALAPETVRRLGCDASVVRILEREGHALAVGRRTRTIPPALRRALRRRDGGCRFPGCTHTRFLHAHHIQHWARGGPTTLGNLVHLCSHHHRLVHEGGFTVEHTDHGLKLRFRRPNGQEIPVVGRCPRPSGPTLEQRHRARGLTVDADTCKGRYAGDQFDYGLAVEALIDAELRGPPHDTS
jgi:Domain of unknown function (DUF222)/HNH endonuclease